MLNGDRKDKTERQRHGNAVPTRPGKTSIGTDRLGGKKESQFLSPPRLLV